MVDLGRQHWLKVCHVSTVDYRTANIGQWTTRYPSDSACRQYPTRIVCLTEETTETLYLLGEGDRVVGVSGYTVRPPEAR